MLGRIPIVVAALAVALGACGGQGGLVGGGGASSPPPLSPTVSSPAAAAPTAPPAAAVTPAPARPTEAATRPVEPTRAAATTTVVPVKSATSIRYEIVSEQSVATYAVQETFVTGSRLATARGSAAIAGALVMDGATMAVKDGSKLTVDLRQLTSDDRRRDGRLQNQWLEAAKFPLAEFVPTTLEGALVEGKESDLRLSGTMTIHATAQPLTFDLKATLKDGTVSGSGTATFKMSAFGITPPDIAGILTSEDDVALSLTFQAKRAG